MNRVIIKNRDNNDQFDADWTTNGFITFQAYGSLFNLGKTFDQILVGEMFYFQNEKVTFVVIQK